MLKENIYYSTDNPNIQIKVDSSFRYVEGRSGELKRQFRNADGSKGIFIHHIKHTPNESQVNYYNHPSQWIFKNISTHRQIDTGTSNISNKQWYYCNSAEIVPNGCLLLRDISRFTDDHDIFFVRYIEGLPTTHGCKSWESINKLSSEQKKIVERLEKNFLNTLIFPTIILREIRVIDLLLFEIF